MPSRRSSLANARASRSAMAARAPSPSHCASATRFNARLCPRTVSGADAAISPASASAAPNASWSTYCTRPIRSASSASTVRPASRKSRAAPWPTSWARRQMLRALRWMPNLPPGMARRAPSAATRKSHATASCIPAPIAGPLIAATTGAGWATIASSTCSNAGRNVSVVASPSAAKRVTRSAPEQNAVPAPVMTMARSAPDCSSCPRNCAHNSAFSALRRSGRSIVATPTCPRASKWITRPSLRSGLVDQRDAIALLHRLAGLDVELAHDARDFGDHGDLHLHRLEDAYLVALGDHLALLDDDLPHVRGDLRADLGHGGGSYAASEILAVSAHALVVLEAHGLPEHLRDLTIAFDQRTQSSRTRGAQPVPGLRVETSREPEAALLR